MRSGYLTRSDVENAVVTWAAMRVRISLNLSQSNCRLRRDFGETSAKRAWAGSHDRVRGLTSFEETRTRRHAQFCSKSVWKLDRLCRSLRDLIAMLDDLKTRGVKFQSLTEAIDTTTPTGRAMWQMIGVLAELERSLISERTRAGVTAAQGRGVKFGRKLKLTVQ